MKKILEVSKKSAIFCLFFLLLLSFLAEAQQLPRSSSLPTFDCQTGQGYILTNTPGNIITSLWSFDLSSGERNLIKNSLIAAAPNQFINSVGYNTVDNYIYGNRVGTTQIVRIGSNGNLEYLTYSGTTAVQASSGDISADGHLFLYDNSKFISINLNSGAPDYLQGVLRQTVSSTINDFAFSPVDGKIYGVTSTSPRRLFKFDPSVNVFTILGNVSGLNDSDQSYGTAFMDNLGNLFVANNNSGRIYRIATPHLLSTSSPITATFYSGVMSGLNPGDGARCPLEIVLPAAIADQGCVTLGSTASISLNVASNDNGGTYPVDPSSVKLLDPVTGLPVSTATISGQGTFTLGSAGIVSFAPLSSFTGTSIQYTISDTQGHPSSPATITLTTCPADLAVTKTVSNATPFVGSNVTFLVTAKNNGPAVATGVNVVENIPSGYEVISITPSSGTWIAPNWSIGTLASGATATLTIVVKVKATGSYANKVVISGNQPDPNLTNNTATATPVPVNVIDAKNDTYSDKSCSDTAVIGNVLSNDLLNGSALNTPVILTTVSGSHLNIAIASDGTITITAGIPAGQYILQYKICETGNTSNCDTATITINITDTTAPTFVEALPADATVECSAVPTAPTLTAIDSCGTATVTLTTVTNPGSCSGNYTVINTWTATDTSGNTTVHVQTVTVQDTTAPAIPVAPQDVTVSCPGDVPPMVQLTAVDNCSGDVTVSGSDSVIPGSCPSSYVIIRTWSFTDNCGNNSTVSQTITVNSNLNVLSKYGVITLTNYVGNASETSYATAVGNTAALNGVTLGSNMSNGATVLHVMGQVMTVTSNLNLNNKFFAFNGTPIGGPINAPNGGQVPTNPAVANEISLITSISNDLKNLANTNNSYAEYFDGNKVKLHLIPNTNGLAILNLNGMQLNQMSEIYFDFAPNIQDVIINVSGINISIIANQNTNRNDLNNKIIWNYYDAINLNFSAKVDGSVLAPKAGIAINHVVQGGVYVKTLTQNARVNGFYTGRLNSSAYIINAPAPALSFSCASEVPEVQPLPASDTCGNSIFVPGTDVVTPGNCPNSFTIVRTWTTLDPCGFTVVASQTITVQDTTAPIFAETLPADATVECASVPTAPTLTATDNCGTATVTFTETTTAGTCAGNYILTRTWTATDLCGLETTHVQIITVQDTTAPTFVEALPENLTVECSEVPAAAILTATDSCGSAAVTFEEVKTNETCEGNYILTRTWTATDLCGLTAVHVQTITVQDTTAPTFVEALPSDLTVECASVPNAPTLTATDNCGTASVTFTETTTAGNCAGNYTLTRTWTATDLCGLETTHVQIITVQDTTAPTFVEALPENLTVECSEVPAAAILTATDSCGSAAVTFEEVKTNETCEGNYILTRTWTATDLCRLTAVHVQTITVQDTTAPTFVEALPENLTVECDAVPTAATLTATDNCGMATVTFAETTTAGTCAGSYILTRTWTATDLCGLTTVHVQTINVQDTTSPTFVETLPADATVECASVPTAPTLTATDNCGMATVTFAETTTAGTCAGSYILTRTWTATDLCGLTTVHVQTINVQDTTSPTFVETLPENLTVECASVPTAPTLTATDNCGTASVAFTETTTAGTCAGNYTLTRTWTATDLCGLTATHVQTITVQDTTAPSFVETLPSDLTVECASVPMATTLTATDSCGTATVTFTEMTTAGTCAGNYTLTRTWTATDLCGLTVTHVQTITVQDTTAPSFVETLPSDLTVECASVPTAPTLTATDNCGTASVAFAETTMAGTCAGNYTLTRTWTATDLCGLTATHVQTITVQDTTAPTFVETLPADVTVECTSVPTAPTLTATDSCGTATVTFTETTTPGTCAGNYTLTRTWTATDLCGLETTHVQTITVQDTTAPSFVEALPADATVECASVPTATTLTATDSCGTATVTFTETTTPGTCAGNYTLTRTWTATDLCGLETTHVQTITVQDTTAPSFVEALPADATVECASVPTATTLTATDSCGTATVTFTETTTPGTCAGNYTLTRTWTATDLCGLETTHVQTITVQDTTAPSFVEALPTDVTVECASVPTAPTLTATNSCGTATVTFTETTTAGTCAGNYTLTRTWTATDLCGLTTTHVQTITVQDTTAPTFVETLPTDLTVECSSVPTATTLTATDSCGTATVTFTETTTAGTCAGNYTLTRTWTATDLCGLTATHIQTITVQDTTAPTFAETLPENLTVECSSVPTATTLTATDSCGTATVTFTETTTAGTCAGNYTLTRTWTATDLCGLTATHIQTITVQDTTAPTFVETLPADATVECSSVPTATTLTATDSCGTATVTFTETTTAGTCAGNYTLTRTWTATDLCGLTATHVQTITVQDTTAPTFVEALPVNVTVECASVPTAPTLTATDNCGTATVTFTETTTAGTCTGNYTLTRTWTATDLCGLTAVHVQTITVQDTTAPTFLETLPSDLTVECASVPNAPTLTATDNCGTATVTFTETTTAGTCPGNYTLTRTWTATDLCGLTATHVQTITVQDTTAPTFVEALPVNVTVECASVPTAPTLTATDNCGTATVTFTETTTAGTCTGNYTLTRTWTATDLCGLTAVHVQTITVQDTTAPTFLETLPSDLTVECASVPNAPTLTATDNCGTATVTFTETTTAGTCPGNYTLTRTWTATDLCGLTATHVQTITVQDTTAPSFVETLPVNVTVECASVPTAPTLTATDSCGTATVTFAETTTAGTCAGNYTLTRTWTATDLCGLTTTHVQTITVQDTTAPTFVETLPTDVTVECASVPTAPILTATDSCGTATVTFTETTTAGTCAGNYILTRTWTATDLCGLETIHVQTITVQDTTAPAFVETLPADATVSCGAIPTAPTLTATDSCGTATVTFTETIASGACAGDSVLTRIWTATDLCGNTTSHTQVITVEDNVAPTTNTVFDAVLNVTCTTINTAPDLQFTDSCSTVENTTFDEAITNQTASGYTIIRTWTATDQCGNVGTASQTINVMIATPVQTISSELCIEDIAVNLFDFLDPTVETNGTWIDTNNSGGLNGSTFNPTQIAVGYYLLSYVIPGGDCPRTIEINMNVNDDCVVLPACTINVHNAMTPNNDGLNDYFQIDGIECYPNNSVEIYNRWGVLVFDAQGYDNATKVFRGVSEGRVTVKQDSELPDGTYFYILKYTDAEGQNKEKASYIYLNR